MPPNPYRNLPAVHDVLAAPSAAALLRDHGHEPTVSAVRATLAALRARLGKGESLDGDLSPAAVADTARALLTRIASARLRPVINATGIIIHTNLGRAPLPAAAIAAQAAAAGYVNLELDLVTGDRSSRQDSVREIICRLTAAESAAVVNNCAAATLLVLRVLAADREVVVSRGQLVEIGGSFRVPEIMAVSGAVLREVGTTNITRRSDYEAAIGPNTAALLRVHQSNFRIRGFTESPTLEELVAVARANGLWIIDDIGSGALLELSRFGLTGEPLVAESVGAGADLVLFSADKMLGGPQAGIIAGRADLVRKIEHDPLMRALRPDKVTLAGLDATLRLYVDAEKALGEVPVLQMINRSVAELRTRAHGLALRLAAHSGISAQVRDDATYIGGGSLPDQALPTAVVAVNVADIGDRELSHRLRIGEPVVVARVRAGALLIDLRTVHPDQEDALVAAVAKAIASPA
jgi:L-seryl-tRNA(Ser) seleniumtransferase